MVDPQEPLFPPQPTARGDTRPGTFYAVSGEDGWIYYAQMLDDGCTPFFRRRDRAVTTPADVTRDPVLCRLMLARPSIGRALRAGRWCALGHFPVVGEAAALHHHVHCPVGSEDVVRWDCAGTETSTTIDDPAVQSLETAAIGDAEYHVARRLAAEFDGETGDSHPGGPLWRQRQIAGADRGPC